MAEQIVKGLRELNAFLQSVPVKVERNILRGALRAGMKTVQPVAKQNIHSRSGELAKGLKIGTKARGGIVIANLKATGRHRSVAHLVEFGTKAHAIKARGGGFLSFLGMFIKEVAHPGAQPKPFMRPALDQQSGAAVNAAAAYMKERLQSKEGINTSAVKLEGDE